jgi:hypothetical protein
MSHSIRLVAAILLLAPCDAGATWEPPEPSTQEWDWVRLDSGEWLKGDLLRLFRDEVDFDSDEFDELRFDWDKVRYFRLPRPHGFRLEGRRLVRGSAEMRDDVIRVKTLEGELQEFPRGELIGIVQGDGSELDRWSANFGVSLSARRGNTDQSDLYGSADLVRETEFARWQTEYRGTFSEVEGGRTANNHRVTSGYDHQISRHFFLRIPGFEFYSDEFQNIEYRLTPSVGVGYDLVDSADVEWTVVTGAAAQYTEFEDGNADTDYAQLFETRIEIDLPRDVEFDNSYRLQLIATDLDKTNHHSESVLSFEVWDPVDFDVKFIWDRIENPQRDNDGKRPKRDDFRLTMGLSLDF